LHNNLELSSLNRAAFFYTQLRVQLNASSHAVFYKVAPLQILY